MVFSSAPQPRGTYELGKRFLMPVEGGSVQAVAVSSSILPFLVSLYTILVTSAVISLWGCVFAVFLRHRLERNRTNALYAALWNKRYSLADTFFEIVPLKGQRKKWGQPSFAPLLCLTFCFLVGQAALAILSPSAIILGRAAPVDPTSIVLPRGSNDINGAFRTAAYDLPAALRAAGSVRVATRELEDQAPVKEIPVGATADGKTINGYQYGYNISGRDLGLQRFSTLRLAVNGGCVTDYGLLSNINTSVQVDTYRVFGDPDSRKPISLGWLDGPGPSLTFILPKPAKPPTTWQTNMTWAVYVSSAYRLSYTAGRDPFYETEEINGPLGFPFQVKPGRPVLSCWESNVWWYGGNSFDNTLNLSSTTLPGFDLPHSLLRVLAKYFGVPSIVRVGQLLGYAGLRTEPVIGLSLNASRTSMLGDLKRLVLTSYIASTATFTDTTLYESLPPGLNNTAIGDDGKPLDGLGDFVVWSSDVAALSLWYIIVIPLLTFSLWLLLLLLLKCTRLRIVKALNASVLYEVIRDNLPEIGPHPSGTWRKGGRRVEDANTRRWTRRLPWKSLDKPALDTMKFAYEETDRGFRDSGVSTGPRTGHRSSHSGWELQGIRETITEVHEDSQALLGMSSPESGSSSEGAWRQSYFPPQGQGARWSGGSHDGGSPYEISYAPLRSPG